MAVQRVLDGYSTQEVAEFLSVDDRSVRRWVASFRTQAKAALAARVVPGRPPKLTRTQEKIVCRWLSESPTEHDFLTELWTGRELAGLIEQEWGIQFHPRYMTAWLQAHGYSPQKPQRVPRQRDPQKIKHWLASDWPRIKKRRDGKKPESP